MIRKILTVLTLTTLIINSAISPAQAADAYMPELIPLPNDSVMFMMVEPSNTQNFNYLITKKDANVQVNNAKDWIYCDSFEDPKCDFNDQSQSIVANSILPVCANQDQIHCVEALSFAKAGEDFIPAEFLRSASGGQRFPEVASLDFPGDGAPSIWQASNAEHSAGKKYSVVVRLSMNYNHNLRKFIPRDFNATVVPVREVPGSYQPQRVSGASNNCAFVESGICGYPQDFPVDTKVKLSFRITNKVGGWFQGRLKDPVLQVSKFNENSNLITVDGSPSTVARFATPRTKSQFTEKEREFYSNSRWGTASSEGSGPEGGMSSYSFPFIEYFRDSLNDTSSGVNTYWSLSTTSWGSGSQCLADTSKIQGIVTTNAMGYDGNAPSFVNGFLDYKVSGFHYMPDGKTEVQGTYDLVMKSETARCLYGFTAAPIYAAVTVISGNSSTLVGTTTVSEKNGWLKLAAYGFTFSEKTIKVKITQQKNQKYSISCAKGKATKKVTGTKPKCPKGFKIKV
jgi:hypothetical protein